MMANGSDIDSWKTETESDESDRGNYTNSQRKSTSINRYTSCIADIRKDTTPIQTKNSISGPEIRYINPAIYTEFINEEECNIGQKFESEQGKRYKIYVN